MNGPSVSHHMLRGRLGSRSYHAGLISSLVANSSSAAGVFQAPPRRIGRYSGGVWNSREYSHTLPIRSFRPKALAFFVPVRWVLAPEFSLSHAVSSGFSGPAAADPARAAYSHSASVGSRKRWPVSVETHSQ